MKRNYPKEKIIYIEGDLRKSMLINRKSNELSNARFISKNRSNQNRIKSYKLDYLNNRMYNRRNKKLKRFFISPELLTWYIHKLRFKLNYHK